MRRLESHRWLIALLLVLLPPLVLASCSTTTSAESISGAQMSEANRLYEDGRFADAAERYQALVDTGIEDGRLFYNLGDAYYKTGDLGHAILNFRRAQRLLPRDGDIAANLELARAQTIDAIDVKNEAPLANLVRRLIRWTTLDEAALTALGLWVILCALMAGALLWTRHRRLLLFISGGVALVLAIGILSIGLRVLDEGSRPPAIIVADVTVHSGPGNDYLTEFTLHAGAEVRVVEGRGDWVRIMLPGGLQGWAPGESVAKVAPRD